MPVRLSPVVLLLLAGLTVAVVGVGTIARPTGPVGRGIHGSTSKPRGPSPDRVVAAPDDALAVLHAWDARRAEAWATGDQAALTRLYSGGSRAGAADLALLRRYAARGLVVRGMRMQLLRARVVVARPRVLQLEVTDRLAGAVAVPVADPASGRRLPADAASTRLVELRRSAGQWVVARVSAVSGG